MKNVKYFVATILLANATVSLNAAGKPNFELYNKLDKKTDPTTVAVSVSNVTEGSRGFRGEAVLLSKGDKFQTNIDTVKPTEIKFWELAGSTDPKSGNKRLGYYSIKPLKGYDGTVYVSFGRKGGKGDIKLYPQTGTWLGLKGKTDSGLPLDKKKNVQQQDITEVVPYSAPIRSSLDAVVEPL